MKSLKRAPDYVKIFDATTDLALANITEGQCINCFGHTDVHLQVCPGAATTATLEIGYWSEGNATPLAIPAEPAITKVSSTPFEITVPAKGRKLAVAVTFSGANGAKIYASGYGWKDPE